MTVLKVRLDDGKTHIIPALIESIRQKQEEEMDKVFTKIIVNE